MTAYTVTRRTREIGIRVSLGASRGEIVGLVLGQGMWLVAWGSAVGLLMGTAAGVLLSGRLNIPGPDVLLIVAVDRLVRDGRADRVLSPDTPRDEYSRDGSLARRIAPPLG